jgi:hypothetical protein
MYNKTNFNVFNTVHWFQADWKNWIEKEESIKKYEYKHFSNFKEVGSGNFGKIYCANWKNSRNPLALKPINGNNVKRIVYGVIFMEHISVFIINTLLIVNFLYNIA